MFFKGKMNLGCLITVFSPSSNNLVLFDRACTRICRTCFMFVFMLSKMFFFGKFSKPWQGWEFKFFLPTTKILSLFFCFINGQKNIFPYGNQFMFLCSPILCWDPWAGCSDIKTASVLGHWRTLEGIHRGSLGESWASSN